MVVLIHGLKFKLRHYPIGTSYTSSWQYFIILPAYIIAVMPNLVKELNDYRQRMNEIILRKNNLVLKRLWNLDTNAYEEGALDKKQRRCWVW